MAGQEAKGDDSEAAATHESGQPPPTMDPEFQAKRKEWIRCLGSRDCNSIVQQVYQMAFNMAVYKVINEARRHASAADGGGVKLNGMMHRFIDDCFVTSQTLAIRRLTDRAGMQGERGVYSITSLVVDIKKYVRLLTRKNLFAAKGLSQASDFDEIERFHHHIDTLCGVAADNRTPSDTVQVRILDATLERLDECQDITTHVDKFVAHAATPESRAVRNADEIALTLGHLKRALEVFCRIVNLIDLNFLTWTSRPFFLPAIGADAFRYIDRPLVIAPHVECLKEEWQRFRDGIQEWRGYNLAWCLDELITEDFDF